ncbi:hypothetical protein [Pseudacidovorax intermedius]|uniref:hypothetical protein n=1 Tax=Pseudacidovorax intermedius TaxID=433924 RepID=UPI000E0ADA10|nr:hypothetical protein [Pseudacidovorax intermedius]
MFEATQEMRALVREQLAREGLASALRAVALQFGLNKTSLAWLAVDLYADVMTSDVQAIWHWDLAGHGTGHTDAELDEMLSHLNVKPF